MSEITKIINETVKEMCGHYCKYPEQEAPLLDDGTPNDNWLFEDGSPCYTCPLNNLV